MTVEKRYAAEDDWEKIADDTWVCRACFCRAIYAWPPPNFFPAPCGCRGGSEQLQKIVFPLDDARPNSLFEEFLELSARDGLCGLLASSGHFHPGSA